MSISFSCPQCGKSIRAPVQQAGRRGRCPGCKAVITVPTRGPDDRGYEVVDDNSLAATEAEPTGAAKPNVWQPTRGRDPGPSDAWSRSPISSRRAPARLQPSSNSPRDRLYWVLVLALLPLGFSLLSEDDTMERFERTR